ncbi:MAG: transporter substrate-binding domain-containing protein [Rhodobacterales bacterium]|nr:transporter substrate-binding domain-containing protein [Rhodobacterales bacterium]
MAIDRPAAPVRLTDYAPGGVLRVAINHGNPILAGRDAAGAPTGISVDLARALAARLGVAPVFLAFDRAADVSAAADRDAWDLCFLAVDPQRAQTIAFTRPYVGIEGRCLVPPGSAAQDAGDVLRLSLRIGAVEGSAYALHLSRAPGAAQLVLFAGLTAAVAALDAGAVDGLAGIGQAMQALAAARPGARVLTPPFMQIRQAMGLPEGRTAALAHLQAFLSATAADGTPAAIHDAPGPAPGAGWCPRQDSNL